MNEKITKGLLPLRRPKLGKNHKIRGAKKKPYESNKWWNYWKFQLHWKKLEWVNKISQTKIGKPYSVSSKHIYLNKGDRTSHCVGHSYLK